MPSSSSRRAADLACSTCRPASAPRPAGLIVAEERVQLVEVQLSNVVDRLAADGEQQPRRAQTRAPLQSGHVCSTITLSSHASMPRVRLAALAVAAVVALDAARDAVEADLAPFLLVARRPSRRAACDQRPSRARCRRGSHRARASGRSFHGVSSEKPSALRQAVHHAPVPGVRVVAERLAHEAAAADAALRVGHQQLGVRQLVDAEPAAGAAGALGVVEHEVLGPDVAVDEVVRRAAQRAVEALRPARLRRALDDVQPAAARRRRAAPRRRAALIAFSCLPADDDAVDDGVHVRAPRVSSSSVFVRDVDRLAVDDHAAAALLAHLGEARRRAPRRRP